MNFLKTDNHEVPMLSKTVIPLLTAAQLFVADTNNKV